MSDLRVIGSNFSDQQFLESWWKVRFPQAQPPNWDSAITCADAADLLKCFRNSLKKKDK